MRWPWRPGPTQPLADATEAAEQAQRSLADARNFDARVQRVSNDLTETLRRNNFAMAAREALRGA